MADILRFIPAYFDSVGPQSVYWKERWQDEWTLVPELWCSEAVWSCGPTISTAQLQLRYGVGLNRFATAFAAVLRARNQLRRYVRVDFVVGPINNDDESDLVRPWYGVIDVELDQLDGPLLQSLAGGDPTYYATGKNHFTCYGLESLLDQDECRASLMQGADAVRLRRALDFNRQSDDRQIVGNRAPDPYTGEEAVEGVYLFHDELLGGEQWSTREAVRYLLAHDTPVDHAGDVLVPFVLLDPDEVVPNWDAPYLVRDGRTPWELLNSLLARQRLLGFRTVVEQTLTGEGGEVRIIPFTFAAEELALTGGNSIAANEDQIILAFERDRGAEASLKRSSSDRYDQVIAFGAPRTSTGTFSFLSSPASLAIGWPSPLETSYEAGGSGDADYPAASQVEERIVWNQQARAADKFRPVYQRFVFPAGLTEVEDGEEAAQLLMPSDTDPEVAEPLAPEDSRFLPELPLLEGITYHGDALEGEPPEVGPSPHKHLQPLVIFRRDDWTSEKPRYRHAESVGLVGEAELAGMEAEDFWSARVRVDHEDGALWVEVSNGDNWTIAATDFSKLDEDFTPPADYRLMYATCAVRWSQFAEGVYPPAGSLPVGRDVIRRLRIAAGPEFRCDYVVPGAIVELSAGGELLRCDGGYARDDRSDLEALAQLAFAWYGETRQALSFSTSLVNNAVELGQLVVGIGDPELEGDLHTEDVNSVVTQIRLAMPLSEGEGAVAPIVPTMHYETAYGELDVLKLR